MLQMRCIFSVVIIFFIQSCSFKGDSLKSFYENGSIKTEWGKNKGNGTYIKYYSNGNLMSESEYSKGVLNGVHKEYYESGKIKEESFYMQGEKTGPYVYYRENNERIEGQLVDGLMVGKTYYFDANSVSSSFLTSS